MKSKFLKFLVPICYISFLCGCGHSIVRTDRGTGFHLRVPNPFQQGDSIVDFKLGNIDSTMAVVRGNTTFDSNSAKGGSFTGVGGISERFALSTNPQLNEGYVAEVLTSPNVSDETKKEIAKYLYTAKAPSVSDSKSITVGAASGSGEHAGDIKPEKTGLDNIVDKTADTIVKAAPIVGDATKDVVKNVSENTSEAVKNISDNTAKTVSHAADVTGETTTNIATVISDRIFISFIIALIITAFIISVFFIVKFIIKKYKEKNKIKLDNESDKSVDEESNELDELVDDPTTEQQNIDNDDLHSENKKEEEPSI